MFNMSLLEKNITRKKQMNKNVIEFNFSNKKKYDIRKIQNSAVYAKKSKVKSSPRFYSLII